MIQRDNQQSDGRITSTLCTDVLRGVNNCFLRNGEKTVFRRDGNTFAILAMLKRGSYKKTKHSHSKQTINNITSI